MNRRALKYFLILFAFVFLVFISNDFGLIDVQKTAIIVAVGIDKGEEDDYVVTTQIASAQSSNEGQEVECLSISSTSKTIEGAIKQIQLKTGWQPNLSNCKLLLVGEELARDNVLKAVQYFFRNEYFSDACLVATCENTAQVMLSLQTPVDDINSFAMQKLINKDNQQQGNTFAKSLKELMKDLYSPNKSSILPFVQKIEQKGSTSVEQTDGQKQSQQGDSEYLYTATKLMLIDEGVGKELLEQKDALTLMAITSKLKYAKYNVELDDDKSVSLLITKSKGKTEFKKEEYPKLKIEVKMSVSIGDTNYIDELKNLSNSSEVNKNIIEKAEKQLTKEIESLFEKSKNSNCDLFDIKKSLYQKDYNDYYKLKEDILKNCVLEIQVKFTQNG